MKIFEKPGKMNTSETLDIAIERAKQLDTELVIATTKGDTILEAMEKAKAAGYTGQIVAVSHVHGSLKPGEDPIAETREALLAGGVKIVTATHLLSGVERAMSTKFGGIYPAEIIAHSLRMLSQGVKVTVEIAAMALDAGTIRYGSPIVAVGGTGRGADTAAVITPAHGNNIFATRVHEILCKPY